MNRRRYLSLASLAVAGLAGCTEEELELGDDEETDDPDEGTDTEATTAGTETNETETDATTTGESESMGPAAVAETFLMAVGDGEIERANELIHSESPQDSLTEDDVSADIAVDESEVISEEPDTAIVRLEVRLISDDDDEVSTFVTYELRTENGEWRLWDTADGGEESPPQVDWGWKDDLREDVVVVEHNVGERVDSPNQIVAREEDGREYGTLAELVGTPISAGDTGVIDVPADSSGEIELVWESSNGRHRQILDTHRYDVRDDGTTEPPTGDSAAVDTVRQFLTAASNGDIETVNELVHSESPLGEITEDDLPDDITIETLELRSQDEDVAIVYVEIVVQTDGEEQSNSFEYELRPENGEWRIYSTR